MDGKDYLVIIGAPKCATSALASWLECLPDAALTRRKETLFFTDYPARRWVGPGSGHADGGSRDDTAFRAQFDHAPEAGLRIEASTDNLSCDIACARMKAFAERDDVRSLKVVAVLRDPVERIVSEFEHTLRLGWQKPDLMASLKAEARRKADGWHPMFHHVARSSYAAQLAPYKAAFGRDLLILDYHGLSEPETLPRLAAFAGRGDADMPEQMERQNTRAVHVRPQAEGVLRNRGALTVARALVPKGLRPRIRALLRGKPVARYVPTDAEHAFMRDALGADMALCAADPDIPTDNWPSLRA